jgi:CheY-like chemotaxis protein
MHHGDRALNILLVDDDEVDVIAIERAFRKANITNPMHIASNGIDALELMRTGKFPAERRLVLLDLNMPKMSGIELLRAIRADPTLETTLVVVLTTANEDRQRVEALQLDVAGYLLKPVTFQAFAEVTAALNKCWTLTEMP